MQVRLWTALVPLAGGVLWPVVPAAATADRIVSPRQALQLWLHWQKPRIEWISSGHLSAPFDRRVGRILREVFESAWDRSHSRPAAP